jgi:hypothetical protein
MPELPKRILMARSKHPDIDRSTKTDASRFDESGSQSASKTSDFNKTSNFNKSSDFKNQRSDDKSSAYAKGGNGFDHEWLDDSGNADEPQPARDLGPSAKLADDIRDAATSAVRAVKEQASAVAEEVGHELGKTAEEQVGRGADAIRGFASAIEAAGAELEKISPQLARYVNDSADKIRNVSNGLSNRQVNDLVGTATDFARLQPAIFFGAAVATGFALARFLKSSAKAAQSLETMDAGMTDRFDTMDDQAAIRRAAANGTDGGDDDHTMVGGGNRLNRSPSLNS